MKTEQDTMKFIEFSSLEPEKTEKYQIQCIGGNEANDYCVNEKCQTQKSFRCWVKKCQCHLIHNGCLLKADLDQTIHKIDSKITDPKNARQKIQDLFDNLIDKLSEIREKILSQLGDRIKYHKLHKIEKVFIEVISSGLKQQFTSKQSCKLFSVVSKISQPQIDILEIIQEKVKKFRSLVQDQSKILEDKISEILRYQQCLGNAKEVFKIKSSVLTEDLLIERLINMYENKMASTRLLFKASEHNFSISKYYQLCGDQTHTMIICKTNKDKIIGAYTPLSFNPNPQYNGQLVHGQFYNQEDSTLSSMVFSLSENNKFKLVNSKYAVRHYLQRNYLTFGNAEFRICDKSNQNSRCQSFLPSQFIRFSYQKPGYKRDKESYLKWNGNEDQNFSTKEWEVWKIQFEQINQPQ